MMISPLIIVGAAKRPAAVESALHRLGRFDRELQFTQCESERKGFIHGTIGQAIRGERASSVEWCCCRVPDCYTM